MDLNDIRSAVTLASLVLFLVLVRYTWSRRRRSEHDAAAALPFAGDGDTVEGPAMQGGQEVKKVQGVRQVRQVRQVQQGEQRE